MKSARLLFVSILFVWISPEITAQIESREFPVEGGYVRCEILEKEKNIRTVDTLEYHFLIGNRLKKLQGSYDGKLLHGKFIQLDLQGNMIVEGEFKQGLHHGSWKYWTNEKLDSTVTYCKGIKHGQMVDYTKSPKVEVEYKKGEEKQPKEEEGKEEAEEETKEELKEELKEEWE